MSGFASLLERSARWFAFSAVPVAVKHFVLVSLIFLSTNVAALEKSEWSGAVAAEYRFFFEDPVDPRQHGNNASAWFEPQYYAEWSQGRQSFLFVPFGRVDQGDDERTHADIREAIWTYAAPQWELRAGIGKVFWGVTEAVHLVDIINQTDLVENPDGEEKLGQPMVNLAWIQNWGTLDFFVLPYFRERTFPGVNGRLRPSPPVDLDNPVYESSAERNHIDYAARWSHFIGDWDLGVSVFNGTSRIPVLNPGLDGNGQPALIPFYPLITQFGLDAQATIGSWLWKLEAIHVSAKADSFYAATGGLEYSFFGVFESAADIGLLFEYTYDQRKDLAPTPFQNDILWAVRLALNDEQSTELLVGIVRDLERTEHTLSLEASRRLGSSWTLGVEARGFSSSVAGTPTYAVRQDDYLQVEIAYHF